MSKTKHRGRGILFEDNKGSQVVLPGDAKLGELPVRNVRLVPKGTPLEDDWFAAVDDPDAPRPPSHPGPCGPEAGCDGDCMAWAAYCASKAFDRDNRDKGACHE